MLGESLTKKSNNSCDEGWVRETMSFQSLWLAAPTCHPAITDGASVSLVLPRLKTQVCTNILRNLRKLPCPKPPYVLLINRKLALSRKLVCANFPLQF